MKHCTFLLPRCNACNSLSWMSFVMKITNFVKSAKTSFLAPLTPKCTRVLRTTTWQAKPKQHNSTHETGPLLKTLTYYFLALLSHCKDGQELENLVLVLMRRDFHSHRMTSSHLILRHRRIATGKRKLSFLPLYKMCV